MPRSNDSKPETTSTGKPEAPAAVLPEAKAAVAERAKAENAEQEEAAKERDKAPADFQRAVEKLPELSVCLRQGYIENLAPYLGILDYSALTDDKAKTVFWALVIHYFQFLGTTENNMVIARQAENAVKEIIQQHIKEDKCAALCDQVFGSSFTTQALACGLDKKTQIKPFGLTFAQMIPFPKLPKKYQDILLETLFAQIGEHIAKDDAVYNYLRGQDLALKDDPKEQGYINLIWIALSIMDRGGEDKGVVDYIVNIFLTTKFKPEKLNSRVDAAFSAIKGSLKPTSAPTDRLSKLCDKVIEARKSKSTPAVSEENRLEPALNLASFPETSRKCSSETPVTPDVDPSPGTAEPTQEVLATSVLTTNPSPTQQPSVQSVVPVVASQPSFFSKPKFNPAKILPLLFELLLWSVSLPASSPVRTGSLYVLASACMGGSQSKTGMQATETSPQQSSFTSASSFKP